jgi:uncharacterized membrane protein
MKVYIVTRDGEVDQAFGTRGQAEAYVHSKSLIADRGHTWKIVEKELS